MKRKYETILYEWKVFFRENATILLRWRRYFKHFTFHFSRFLFAWKYSTHAAAKFRENIYVKYILRQIKCNIVTAAACIAEIMEIYCGTFDRNFVKPVFLQNQLLKNWFRDVNEQKFQVLEHFEPIIFDQKNISSRKISSNFRAEQQSSKHFSNTLRSESISNEQSSIFRASTKVNFTG